MGVKALEMPARVGWPTQKWGADDKKLPCAAGQYVLETGKLIIRFELEISCGDDEPSRYVSTYRGEIFDYPELGEGDEDGYSEPNMKIGEIDLYYIDHAQIVNDYESLYETMDCVSSDTLNCYEALVDQDKKDWKAKVENLVGEDALINYNILL